VARQSKLIPPPSFGGLRSLRSRPEERFDRTALIHRAVALRDLLDGVPSTLKAWFDHAVRSGHTFTSEDGRCRPLLEGRRAKDRSSHDTDAR
jgi:hypothetical protein